MPSLIITEVADPNDELEARFVEIYNNGTTAIDLTVSQIHFVKQVNAGSSYASIALTGTIQPNTVYIIGNSANINTHYGFASDIDFSDANGNGDDAYFLYFGGDKDTGTLLDAYGVLGIDGTGETWEYANTRAYRTNPKTVFPNATWTASEWTVETTSQNITDMTPGALENEFRYDGNWKPRDVYANITAFDDVLILSNITLTDAITAKNFDVNASINATIPSGKSLIVSGTSTGNITYQRNLAVADKWYLVSAPVSGETIQDLIANHAFATGTAPNIGLAPYDNTQPAATVWNYQTTASTGAVNNGQGYSVRLATPGDILFTGTLNTSDVSIALTQGSGSGGDNFNLLGNPFTSFIDSNRFLTTNTSELTSETIWLWNQGTGIYDTKVTANNFKIAPGQGFFVEATTTNSVTFAKANQSHEATDTFQRQTVPEIKVVVADESTSRYAEIYYYENATTGFDNGYDGELFGGTQNSFEIYSHLLADNQGDKYQIQSLPNTDYESMVIPFGVKATAGKEITFSVEAVNLPTDVNVYLEDKEVNIFTHLDEVNTEYTVTLSEALDGVGRFYIHTSTSVLTVDDATLSTVHIYKSDISTVRIVGLPQGNATVKLFSVEGKEVLRTSFTTNGIKDISLPRLATGVYIVEIQTEIGRLNKKIGN
ncbi:MAG: lamin tail domain-containing protein [Polaribacter sp.]